MNRPFFMLLLGFAMYLCGCNKDKLPDDQGDQLLVYHSLQAERDTIFTEDTTAIRALATGYNLEYHWFVEKGDLLGSGSEITFLATPCTVGENEIHCTIWDGNGQHIDKYVTITVF